MSKAQMEVLIRAQQTGNAIDEAKLHKNGAHLRMITRMAKAGLLDPRSYDITDKGKQVLRDAGKLKDQRKFRIKGKGVIWTLTVPAIIDGEPVTVAMAQEVMGKFAAYTYETV